MMLANSSSVPLLHMLATFACYTLIAKKPLSAAIVFSALTGAPLVCPFVMSMLTQEFRFYHAPVCVIHGSFLCPKNH
jgi:hypothetical protein